jgi:hypothetical protein
VIVNVTAHDRERHDEPFGGAKNEFDFGQQAQYG